MQEIVASEYSLISIDTVLTYAVSYCFAPSYFTTWPGIFYWTRHTLVTTLSDLDASSPPYEMNFVKRVGWVNLLQKWKLIMEDLDLGRKVYDLSPPHSPKLKTFHELQICILVSIARSWGASLWHLFEVENCFLVTDPHAIILDGQLIAAKIVLIDRLPLGRMCLRHYFSGFGFQWFSILHFRHYFSLGKRAQRDVNHKFFKVKYPRWNTWNQLHCAQFPSFSLRIYVENTSLHQVIGCALFDRTVWNERNKCFNVNCKFISLKFVVLCSLFPNTTTVKTAS